MAQHLIDFATAVAANPGSGDYAVKSAPSGADLVYLGDVADSNKVKRASLSSILTKRPFRGVYDASTNTYPTPATAPIRTGEAIDSGDQFLIGTAGTLNGQSVTPTDLLVAEVDNPSGAADWTIVNGAVSGSDTHMMQQALTNNTAAALLHNANNQDWGIDNIDNYTIAAVTAQATSGGAGVWEWNSARTITLGAYTTGGKLEGTVGAATQLLGTTATGDLVQVSTGGLSDTNTHIFDTGLADQGADASHNQAGFNVEFDQSTSGSGISHANGSTDVAGFKEGKLRILGGNGNFWDVSIGTLGQIITTDSGSSAF